MHNIIDIKHENGENMCSVTLTIFVGSQIENWSVEILIKEQNPITIMLETFCCSVKIIYGLIYKEYSCDNCV